MLVQSLYKMLKGRPLPQRLFSRLQAGILQDLFPVLSNLTACLSRKHAPNPLSHSKNKDHPTDLQTHFKVHLAAGALKCSLPQVKAAGLKAGPVSQPVLACFESYAIP